MRPKLAVYKFASCDGCQLSLLDCEDELLALTGVIEIAYFPEASRAWVDGPYDLVLVEGSITTPRDRALIREVREVAKHLVTIGACATSGGIQALRNYGEVSDYLRIVYAHPDYIETLATSTPISDHVKVDFELRGCPVDKHQLIEVITAFVAGRKPAIGRYAVCLECKMAGHVCVMVANRTPCLGPVTHAGCGALCPGYHRGCYGCFGPQETARPRALSERLAQLGTTRPELLRLFRTFNAGDPVFGAEGTAHA